MAFQNGIYFALLIALTAIPLIFLRGLSVLESPWLMPSFTIAAVALCGVWWRTCDIGLASVRDRPRLFPQFWSVLAILALITLVAFYIPQRQHFWGGYDDFQAFQPKVVQLWGLAFDRLNGRPALGWSYVFGRALGRGAIEGFLWYAAIQCCVNALLLWAIIQTMLPNARALGLTVAMMLIINRADPLKFYPLWAASPYGLAVGCLLFAIWMLLVSSRRKNRGLLVLACASLGASLLMYEVGYLLAAIPLLLLWIDRKQNNFWRFWAFSWIATWMLFATRVAIFQLTNASSYQLQQASAAKISPQSLIENFKTHLRPIGKYFELSSAISSFWVTALAVFVVAAFAVWWIGREDQKPTLRAWGLTLLLAGIGIVLGITPYSHMAGNERTQFFAAPSQAIFVTFALCLPGYYLPRRVGLVGLSMLVGLLSANATVMSYQTQNRQHHVTYDKAVHVCQQIRAMSSALSTDTLIVLLHEGAPPLGANYCSYAGSEYWVGARIVQMGEEPEAYMQVKFGEDEVRLWYFDHPLVRYPYEKLIIYRLDADGTLYLQSEWPKDQRLIEAVTRYSPLALLRPGPIARRYDFDFPSWSGPPRDIVTQRDGIVLGRGWSSLGFEDGWLFREAEHDAELVVNGQGNSSTEVNLELGPLPNREAGCTFEILTEQNAVIATGDLLERRKVHLRIPCDQNSLAVLRLKVNSRLSTKPVKRVGMRVYCSDGPLASNPLSQVENMVSGGVRMGKGWYPCETHDGRQLRWLNTDGEIFTGPCDVGESPALVLEAAIGPGMESQPCTIRLLDTDGQALASAVVAGRERVSLKLPANIAESTRLTLQVQGGGKTIPGDPRILNLMVTKCEWQSTAIPIPDIAEGGIELGKGWYACETAAGEAFRWLNTGGEIYTGPSEDFIHPTLVLDVGPGPGLYHTPCMIDVMDATGQALATATFENRQRVAVELPVSLPQRTLLRLQVRDGGRTIANDPRVLNAQVFRCEWQANAGDHR